MSKHTNKSNEIAEAEVVFHKAVKEQLLSDVRALIESAKSHLAQTVNTVLFTLYWHIGKRIKTEILGNERAQYGKEIVSTLSRQLTVEYGAGFSEKSLWHMIRFAEIFHDEQIVSALQRELSWSHFNLNSHHFFIH